MPAVHEVHVRLPRWPVQTVAWTATNTFYSICPLGQTEVPPPGTMPPDGQIRPLPAQNHQNTYCHWHGNLLSPDIQHPSPFGRVSVGYGCNPPIPPLGPTHGAGLVWLLSWKPCLASHRAQWQNSDLHICWGAAWASSLCPAASS
jgi:hypothetical protein